MLFTGSRNRQNRALVGLKLGAQLLPSQLFVLLMKLIFC